MKFIRLCCCLLGSVALGACAYHNKLPRDIFSGPATPPKITKSVALVANAVSQKQFAFKDYHSAGSVHTYKISLADGSLAATAEALATLFETVEVVTAKEAAHYDYRAELDYTVSGPQTDSLDSVQWFGWQPPILETRVIVKFYDNQANQPLFSAFATRHNRVELDSAAAVTQRLETKGKTVFLPLTGPLHTEQFGNDLRDTLARDLAECLTEIAHALQQNRILFEPHPQNNVK